MTATLAVFLSILQEDVLLTELTATEAEISIEIPILIGQ